MLESLDTLIAFVVILSVASLLVTIVVQTISATFSLRGWQLLRGLQNAGNAFAPDAMNASEKLADALLRKPNLIGIKRLVGAVRPDEIYDALKKLAAVSDDQFRAAEVAATDARTAANTNKAAVDALCGALSLEETIKQAREAVESAKTKAELAAATAEDKAALETKTAELQKLENAGPLETEALKLEADLALLKKYRDSGATTGATSGNPDLSAEAARLLASLMPETQKSAAIRDALGSVVQQISVTCIPAEQRKSIDAAIQQASRQIITQADSLKAAVEQWFNNAVDHAQEWFLGWIRAITIGVGIIMAFVFQWDAVEIFKQVSGPNNALRDALVKKAADVIKEAEGRVSLADRSTDVSVSGGLLERIQEAWNESEKGKESKITDLTSIKSVSQMRDGLPKQGDLAKDTAVAQAFDVVSETAIKKYYEDQARTIQSLASVAGFEFIPQKMFARWPIQKAKDGKSNCPYADHVLGMLIFAALLGLGAPFWFNLLKNLSNLRPALASLLDATSPSANK